MDYRFEEVQNLQFVVYDVDDKHHVDNIDKQQLLGAMECTLGDIVAAGVHLTKPLGLKGGYIFVCMLIWYCSMWLYCACIVQCMILCKYTYLHFHSLSLSVLHHCLSFLLPRQPCWYDHYSG